MSLDKATSTSELSLLSYSDRPSRITKEDLFMVLALWMEHFPVESKEDLAKGHQKVGAVLVLPNDILYAVDCTRDGVHGVARLLMNHPDIAKDCKVFVSRKPCSFCTKLLVQSKVDRVFFPPFEPEYHGVFKKVLLNLASPSGLDDFILNIRKQLADNHVPTENVNNINDPTALAETFNSEPELTKLTAAVFEKLAESENPNSKKKISDAAVKLALKEFECETSQVDTLFTRSSIGQSVFMPKVEKPVLENVQKKDEATSRVEEAVLQCKNKNSDSKDRVMKEKMKEKIDEKTNELFKKFWNVNWMETVNKNLPWPAFDDKMEAQAKKDFESTMKWMAEILVASELGAEEISFQKVKTKDQTKDQANDEANDEANDQANDKAKGDKAKDNGKILNFKRAAHLIKMARFLAGRTDDPKTGVGAVIATDEEKEIKALGWNGFPLKALYGEFPRASDDDHEVEDKKYPFVIHAEQNALLMRNDKKFGEDATLFVTKTPCDECVPLIQMQGIKTVVLGEKLKTKESKDLSYSKFQKKVDDKTFICYQMQTEDQEKLDLEITPESSRSNGKEGNKPSTAVKNLSFSLVQSQGGKEN